jgi:hypothetical protein
LTKVELYIKLGWVSGQLAITATGRTVAIIPLKLKLLKKQLHLLITASLQDEGKGKVR